MSILISVRVSLHRLFLQHSFVVAVIDIQLKLASHDYLFITFVDCPVLCEIVTIQCSMCNIFMTAILICMTDLCAQKVCNAFSMR